MTECINFFQAVDGIYGTVLVAFAVGTVFGMVIGAHLRG